MNRPLSNRFRSGRLRAAMIAVLGAVTACGGNGPPADSKTTALVVFNAGALAIPLRQALDSFSRLNRISPSQESAGSVESVRKIVDLGRTPDIIAVADTALFGSMLRGRIEGPIAILGRSRLVLAYTDRSRFADSVNSTNWTDFTTRPAVQVGRSDPTLDPAGYRALMAMQLAERYYRQPGLATRLMAAAPERDMRPKSSDLTALLETGNLDYAWEYESVARAMGLRFISLPAEIDLGDPSLAATYSAVQVPIAPREGVVMRGAPIVFGAAVPKDAKHADIARRFITYLMSGNGRAILHANGLQSGNARDSTRVR